MKIKSLCLVLLSLLLFSCGEYKYPSDPNISEENGAPTDSLVSFLPAEIEFGGNDYKFEWDAELLESINGLFLRTNDGILYNYYQKNDVYRVLYQESFECRYIWTLNITSKNNWLSTKKICYPMRAPNICYMDIEGPEEEIYENASLAISDSLVTNFKALVSDMKFFDIKTTQFPKVGDPYILMEVHQKNKYWYVIQSAEGSSLKPIVDFFKANSNLE